MSKVDVGIVSNCEGSVRCLAVRMNGARVTVGCADGDVFIWTKASEGLSLCYKELTSFAFPDHPWLTVVAIARSGDSVVADADNGHVAV